MDSKPCLAGPTAAEDAPLLNSGNPFAIHRYGVTDEECPLLHDDIDQEPSTINGKSPALIILCISCTTLVTSLLSGTMTVSVPQIAADLGLDPSLELWYVPESTH